MPPVKCPKCFKMLSSKKSLKVHFEKKNPCDKVCPVCKIKFTNQREYHTHRKTHVKIEEPNDEIITSPTNQIRVYDQAEQIPTSNMLLQELFPLEEFTWEMIVLEEEQTTSRNDENVHENVREKIRYERTVIKPKTIEAKQKMKLKMQAFNNRNSD